MEEPSVLDYVKAKLKFWKKSDLTLANEPVAETLTPPADVTAGAPDQPVESAIIETVKPVALVETYPQEEERIEAPEEPERPPVPAHFPWMPLLALALALLAQFTFEPPERKTMPGLAIYILAAALMVVSALRNEWVLSVSKPVETLRDPLTVRRNTLLIAIPWTLLTAIAFKDGQFTTFNFIIWLVTLFCFVRAFWLGGSSPRATWQRARAFFTRRAWNIRLTRWGVLLVLVALVVVFFRVYQLNAVPSEMVSDQAEKLLDVQDVLNGTTPVFFERNTGREALQFYLTAALIKLFGTGISFLSLKIGTVLAGLLTLPFIYLLGKEVGNRRVGLLAALFAGIAYWPNVISRFGLRFPFYPLFVAPTLYFLVRGLRRSNRNDFILSGIFLGIGLHGYTPIRILPLVVVVAVGLYLIHRQSRGYRKQTIIGLLVLALMALIVFLPLLMYAFHNPTMFAFRAFSRLGSWEQPLPGPAWQIFLKNLWNAVTMFFWSDGEIWPISVTFRPALDVVSAALFFAGIVLLLVRYIQRRHWLDLFLILSIPMLMLSSILSLAFPNENPAINRAGGAMVPVFVVVALGLDAFLAALDRRGKTPVLKRAWQIAALAVFALLFVLSARQNYDLVFRQYKESFDGGSWNTTEMGEFIRDFAHSSGSYNSAWVVAYPYWVDTRLVGMTAGQPERDYAIAIENLYTTTSLPLPKLFIINLEDQPAIETLNQLYPDGVLYRHTSPRPNKDFLYFLTLSPQGALP